ncbi:hypothetical protein RB195_009492 [Necator americanus]|uniref:Uncharacterized protein n=1 Tax=Necator americanus TaxID=51031 RepID=A0ABR1CTJ8_NECAM
MRLCRWQPDRHVPAHHWQMQNALPPNEKIVVPKRHDARCICVRARNDAVEGAVRAEVTALQTAATGGASKGPGTLLARRLAYTTAPCFMSF